MCLYVIGGIKYQQTGESMAEGLQFNPNDSASFRFARRLATRTRSDDFGFLAGLPDLATQKGGSLAVDAGRASINIVERDESRPLLVGRSQVASTLLRDFKMYRSSASGQHLARYRTDVELGEPVAYERGGVGLVGITITDGELFQQDRTQLGKWIGRNLALEVELEPCEEFVLDLAAYYPANENGLDDVLTMVADCAPTCVDLFDVQLYQ